LAPFRPRLPPPSFSPLFPYTTLFRSLEAVILGQLLEQRNRLLAVGHVEVEQPELLALELVEPALDLRRMFDKLKGKKLGLLYLEDRKSTRLNSSHVAISYAVFCLQKK